MAEGFGAFGKMPSVGDFFRLNPPAGFVSVWDEWIQRAMLLAQSALGPDWDAHYMSAPIWRFSLSAGLAGPHKVMGVAMPSVDRVGRRFPLTLMAVVPAPGPAPLDHFCQEPLFERLEDLALDALEDGMTRDLLAQRLSEIPLPQSRPGARVRQSGAHSLTLRDAAGSVLPDLAAGLLAERCRRPSLWSAVIDQSQRLLVCDGLPAGSDMQGLFHLDAPVWAEAEPA